VCNGKDTRLRGVMSLDQKLVHDALYVVVACKIGLC
jgi:hypothetical protein